MQAAGRRVDHAAITPVATAKVGAPPTSEGQMRIFGALDNGITINCLGASSYFAPGRFELTEFCSLGRQLLLQLRHL